MILVINEWLLHDLRDENGSDAQRGAIAFLQQFRKSKDRMIVLNHSRWMAKANGLTRFHDMRSQLGLALTSILFDPNLCTLVSEYELPPLSDQLAQQTLEEDHYLVQLYLASDADLLVTSDAKLRNALDSVESINVRLRDEFLQEYSSG